jgi:hypothetical protein
MSAEAKMIGREPVPPKKETNSPLASVTKIVGIAATAVSMIFSAGGFLVECQSSKNKLALENQRQKHEIRVKYLDLALAEKSEAFEKGRILRFLKLIDDDTTIQKWADSELKIVDENKAATKAAKDSLITFVALGDSIKKLSKNASKFQLQISDLQKRREEVKAEVERLKGIMERTAKEAGIARTSHGFKIEDIQFSDLPIGPNCNLSTIRSTTNVHADNITCLDSYGNQAMDSVLFQKKMWQWVPARRIKWDKVWDKAWTKDVLVRKCECQE